MKIFLPALFLLFTAFNGLCQIKPDFRYSDVPKFLDKNGDPMSNAFAGGLESPQFSQIDLNQDGIKDLFVYDKLGAKILTFINKGTPGQVSYTYAPKYEDMFPRLTNWALLVDYNYDGKEDIFCSGSGGIKIYKNTTTTSLSFQLVTELLLDQTGLNVYTSNVAIPAISDVDHDGDMDVLAFGVLGGFVEFTRNLSKDLGYSQDSLIFQSVDACWGSFEELASRHNANLGINCPFYTRSYKTAAMHSGSSLLALDMDNDGDHDLIHGSVGFNELIYFKNGKKENMWPIDTMVHVDTIFPLNTKQAYIFGFPAAYYLDVNNDGKKDLIVTPNDLGLSKNINQVFYYKNTGTALVPVFTFQQDDFLQDQMVDVGSGIAPAFFDYDLDGDNDLFLGTHGNFQYTNNFQDRIMLYKNTGTSANPVYQLLDTNYLSLASLNLSSITPNFGDLNGDGKKDLIFGDYNGLVYYYQNMGGTPNTFQFTDTLNDNAGLLDVGAFSTPQLVDLNKDGKPDLVIGELAGNFNYYENTGTTTSHTFNLVNDSLGNVYVNDSTVQYNYDPNTGQILDSFYVYEQAGFSAPFVTDIDNDGDYDMLTGTNSGRVLCYTDIDGNLSGTFTKNDRLIFDEIIDTTTSKYLGERTTVTSEKLNPGNIPDLMIGNYRGGLNAFLGWEPGIGIQKRKAETSFSIYPNPASGIVSIVAKPASANMQVRIFNTLGQLLLTETNVSSQVDVSSLKEGMYIIEISLAETKSTSRLAVIRP